MSEPKFTPGPWTIVTTDIGDDEFIIVPSGIRGRNGESVVDSDGGLYTWDKRPREQINADARLIAAAPDLFAALKAIINSDMAMREEDEGRESPELDAARAAIAQAEGGAK